MQTAYEKEGQKEKTIEMKHNGKRAVYREQDGGKENE